MALLRIETSRENSDQSKRSVRFEFGSGLTVIVLGLLQYLSQ